MDLPTNPFENITPELAAALSKLQGDLPKIERNRHVDVETKDPSKRYGYDYATLCNITDKIMPKLATYGLAFTSFPGTCSDGKMGLRYYLTHASGGWIKGEFPLSGEGGIQILGGRITYAKRYALLAATGLAAEEDDDAARAQAEDESTGRAAQRRNRGATAQAARASENTARRREAGTPLAAENEHPIGGPPAETPEKDYTPRNPDGDASGKQLQKLAIQFGELGIADRGARITILGQLVNRQLSTAKELTAGEAHSLINLIDAALQDENPIETLKAIARDAVDGSDVAMEENA